MKSNIITECGSLADFQSISFQMWQSPRKVVDPPRFLLEVFPSAPACALQLQLHCRTPPILIRTNTESKQSKASIYRRMWTSCAAQDPIMSATALLSKNTASIHFYQLLLLHLECESKTNINVPLELVLLIPVHLMTFSFWNHYWSPTRDHPEKQDVNCHGDFTNFNTSPMMIFYR